MEITKELVYQGAELRIKVEAPVYGEEAHFTIGPPDAGDASRARAIRLKHVKAKEGKEKELARILEAGGDINPDIVDLSSALEGEDEARFYLMARALSRGQGEEWTAEDVKKIRAAVLNRIWDEVDALTGFSKETAEAIKGFRRRRKAKGS